MFARFFTRSAPLAPAAAPVARARVVFDHAPVGRVFAPCAHRDGRECQFCM